MNSSVISGRLTKDPDVRYNPSGMATARFTVACDRRFKKEGEPTADFINCVAFGKTAEFVEKYFAKGKGIMLNGRIQTGSYTNKEGQKVFTTDVVAENVEFLGSKSEETERPAKQDPPVGKAPDEEWMSIPDNIGEDLPFA